jgi:hypothetical protein
LGGASKIRHDSPPENTGLPNCDAGIEGTSAKIITLHQRGNVGELAPVMVQHQGNRAAQASESPFTCTLYIIAILAALEAGASAESRFEAADGLHDAAPKGKRSPMKEPGLDEAAWRDRAGQWVRLDGCLRPSDRIARCAHRRSLWLDREKYLAMHQ